MIKQMIKKVDILDHLFDHQTNNPTVQSPEKGHIFDNCLVTFDQNGQNAVSAEFGILAASLPNWRFRTNKDVI